MPAMLVGKSCRELKPGVHADPQRLFLAVAGHAPAADALKVAVGAGGADQRGETLALGGRSAWQGLVGGDQKAARDEAAQAKKDAEAARAEAAHAKKDLEASKKENDELKNWNMRGGNDRLCVRNLREMRRRVLMIVSLGLGVGWVWLRGEARCCCR